ncbi:alpha-amylase family protein [Paenibacillus senegalensis]|uniref:alpha-amylase family protein n=1 Tax=Paenibacillus senegalensis TaxID=1465766 RepID=UPI00028A1647|nr:alpha-amylase family protein [Paenibacillus senegalensis]
MNEVTKTWWEKPLRIIQPNLQVKDTSHIQPGRLADQLAELGANTVVFNVGGIYAWYRTEVPYHTMNEYLPENGDLLMEVIRACHDRGLRFVARFDFSKAEDSVYLQRPEWFVRDAAGEPQIIGARRPGNWSLLMSTCINGAYRTDGVAIPVLEEVLNRYPIDGVFFNNPGYIRCCCSTCQRKYKQMYGEPLPAKSEQIHPSWATNSMKENIDQLYGRIKQTAPSIPLILYYNLYRDNLYDRAATADMLCTEPQDVLSLGHHNIPEFWKPALSIKLGRSLPDRTAPFGIVHSSPGMDWRHTGLPPAEYRFWLCQIPANGGMIWHSLTGVPDTIEDKRVLQVVQEHNEMVKRIEPYMFETVSSSEAALLWNAEATAEGWADGFLERQVPFDVILPEQAEDGRLARYKLVVVPGGIEWTPGLLQALQQFAKSGGSVLVEGIPEQTELAQLHAWLGVEEHVSVSEELIASYLRFEQAGEPLRAGMELAPLIAHRGRVAYCRPLADTEVLATLVPPFSPLESVGAPPERASLAVRRTDLPLIVSRACGQGRVLLLTFSLSSLINEFRLGEHYLLVHNLVRYLQPEGPAIEVSHSPGLQVSSFRKESGLLIHLVNGSGRRPLTANVPLHGLVVKVKQDPRKPFVKATALQAGQELQIVQEGGYIKMHLPPLSLWETLRLT